LSIARYYLWVSGCQMNGSDARRLAELLDASGMTAADRFEDADVAVLYSCSVRQSAEDRVHGQLGHLKSIKARKPEMLLCVTGCMAGADQSELKQRYPFVDLFIAPTEMEQLPTRLLAAADGDAPCVPTSEGHSNRVTVSVGVTVIRGCDKYCSYCIVPYRRGRQQSRKAEEIVAEARGLLSRGAREIVLLGQTVDAWGRDLSPQSSLAALMRELATLPGLYRMRFLTSHPNDFTDDLIEALASIPQLCADVNLPVQAGDDQLLRHMGRPYTVGQYLELIDRIRSSVPQTTLATDVIVGFPGETEQQFQNTLALLRHVEFETVHVAAYSPRPGTAAARKMVDDVPAQDKKRRLQLIEEQQTEIAARKNALLKGSRVEVLVERRSKGKWTGRTRSNRLVFFESELKLRGELVEIEVEGSGAWSLRGRLAQKAPKS